MSLPRIAILGAGYGSLMTLKQLQKELNYNEAQVILVNQNTYHYMTTKLHESAAGTAHHDHARLPISSILDGKKTQFIQDRVTKIHVDKEEIELENSASIEYDYLVIGLGSSPETFGISGLMENAFFIRNINHVRMICKHIEYMFSRYWIEKKDEYLTIIVGGAGFTGIEFVGELVDRIPNLCHEFDVPQAKVRIVNVEAAPTILPGFDTALIDYAKSYLESKNVEFLVNTPIGKCTDEGITLKGGEEIPSKTVVWTGGVRGNKVVETSGLENVRGRVKVDAYLRAPDSDHIFLVGDCSLVMNTDNRPFPPTAQMATQQGQHVGMNLISLLRNGELTPFRYVQKGTIASLGRKEAIGFVGDRKLRGGSAALLKRFLDLRWLYLLGGIPLVLRKGRSNFF